MRIVALTALLAAGLITGLAAPAVTQTRAETYTDKSGDASPDITTVVMSHDAGGVVTLAVTALGMGASLEEGTWRGVSVFAEPDDDTTPASPPYDFEFHDWGAGTACVLYKDNGAGYAVVPSAVSCTRSGDTVTWTFPKSAIAANKLFSFFVVAWHLNQSGGAPLGQDRAPDSGRWGYSFAPATTSGTTTTPTPVARPVIGKPSASPPRPVAGKAFSVTFAVSRSDTGAPLLVGTMRCDPRIAGRALAHRERFAFGKARLWMRIPAAARGLTLQVHLTITSKSASATRAATFRIAPP